MREAVKTTIRETKTVSGLIIIWLLFYYFPGNNLKEGFVVGNAQTTRRTMFDFDGDGRADIGVFRNGVWYLINSSTNQFQVVQFGLAADKPVPAAFLQ